MVDAISSIYEGNDPLNHEVIHTLIGSCGSVEANSSEVYHRFSKKVMTMLALTNKLVEASPHIFKDLKAALATKGMQLRDSLRLFISRILSELGADQPVIALCVALLALEKYAPSKSTKIRAIIAQHSRIKYGLDMNHFLSDLIRDGRSQVGIASVNKTATNELEMLYVPSSIELAKFNLLNTTGRHDRKFWATHLWSCIVVSLSYTVTLEHHIPSIKELTYDWNKPDTYKQKETEEFSEFIDKEQNAFTQLMNKCIRLNDSDIIASFNYTAKRKQAFIKHIKNSLKRACISALKYRIYPEIRHKALHYFEFEELKSFIQRVEKDQQFVTDDEKNALLSGDFDVNQKYTHDASPTDSKGNASTSYRKSQNADKRFQKPRSP